MNFEKRWVLYLGSLVLAGPNSILGTCCNILKIRNGPIKAEQSSVGQEQQM